MTLNTTLLKALNLVTLALLSATLNAQVLHVDDGNASGTEDGTAQYPYQSIQSAILSAGSNDLIKVAAGTYPPITNLGKSLTIQGGYAGGTQGEYSGGAGGDFGSPIADPSLTAISGGDDSIGVVLTRFDFEPFSLTLTNLTVSDSRKGIVCDQLISWPHVENVTISDCIVENNGDEGVTSLGGGIFFTGNGHRLLNSIIRDNQGGRGPAICGNFSAEDSLLIEGNRIEDNTGYDDHCGGVYLAGFVEIRNNIISGNVLDNTYGWGGGVLILGTAYMSGNVIRNNHAPSYGGAVFVDEGGICYLTNELIHNNTTDLEGAAVAADHGDPGSSYVYLTNCTVANNQAPGGNGGNGVFVDNVSFATVTNCIFYGNGDDFFTQGGSQLTTTFTLSEESTGGMGNFTADPLFADAANGDYHVRSTAGRFDPVSQSWVIDGEHSPAIDAGDPASPYANEPSPNGDRINLGFDGNTAYASKSGPTAVTGLTSEEAAFTLQPNPAHDRITIGLPASIDPRSTIQVFNELGEELMSQPLDRAFAAINVSTLANGSYLLVISSPDGSSRSRRFAVAH